MWGEAWHVANQIQNWGFKPTHSWALNGRAWVDSKRLLEGSDPGRERWRFPGMAIADTGWNQLAVGLHLRLLPWLGTFLDLVRIPHSSWRNLNFRTHWPRGCWSLGTIQEFKNSHVSLLDTWACIKIHNTRTSRGWSPINNLIHILAIGVRGFHGFWPYPWPFNRNDPIDQPGSIFLVQATFCSGESSRDSFSCGVSALAQLLGRVTWCRLFKGTVNDHRRCKWLCFGAPCLKCHWSVVKLDLKCHSSELGTPYYNTTGYHRTQKDIKLRYLDWWSPKNHGPNGPKLRPRLKALPLTFSHISHRLPWLLCLWGICRWHR